MAQYYYHQKNPKRPLQNDSHLMVNQVGVSLTFCELSKILSLKLVHSRYQNSDEHFKLKLSMCAQSMALGTCTKFWLEILAINGFSPLYIFTRLFWRACELLVKQPPAFSALTKNLIPGYSTNTKILSY